VIYDFARATIQGARRYQEDSALVVVPGANAGATPTTHGRAEHLFAVLADGMGGHAGGSVASQMVCATMVATYLDPAGSDGDRLLACLDRANAALDAHVERNPNLSGMGSTVIGAVFDATGVAWVSVGDSLLYLWRAGRLTHLNEDHSLAPEIDRLAAAGKISAEEARNNPRRHYLRSAVTGEPIELIDRPQSPTPIEPGDVILIASDGLHTLSETQITSALAANADRPLPALVAELLARVEARREPHQDNTTLIALRAS
jgi:PPM family protein phosphatase